MRVNEKGTEIKEDFMITVGSFLSI